MFRTRRCRLPLRRARSRTETNSPDNWNIKSIRITAYDPNGEEPPVCVFRVAAKPLVRLHDDGSGLSFFRSRLFADHR
jgi:hypothetical protein